MEKAIVTLAIGEDVLLRYAAPLMKLYATKVEAEFIVIKERKTNHPVCPMLEKHQIYELFDKYDRILLMDVDIVIHPKSPDIFNVVPVDKIGAVYDNGRNDGKIKNRGRGIKVIADILGDKDWWRGNIEEYINSGVILASKIHRDVFKYDRRIDKINQRVFLEQNLTNYNIKKLGFKIHRLDRNFNRIAFGGKEQEYFDNGKFGYFIHFAGKAGKAELQKKYFYRVLR